MIAQLTGRIALRALDHLVIDVNGVGYRVTVPLSTLYALPDDGVTTLQIHTHVKEDALQLFGFLTGEEKELFALLISVSGVGPKLAVNILSNIPVDELRQALANGDSKRLACIPGIGKKTAERLVVDLREKVAGPQPPSEKTADRPAAIRDNREDALSALVNLGYKAAQAKKVLDGLEIDPDASVEQILKTALRRLVR
ncbi:Holliday junction DNA helicase subunit RuvA [Geothermobacter ehrlichii]|uniref:Holliday junction branch migration complex subunit RuvA n=1 Tax=Geothermobacter ehrlichii TaxID=213224 RepID=A0A5D3WJC9_9BACT|nr:Holliday junction branch migration protein RuvA [Geothermobacter ehrlichii]TYO98298.1 Holliday junction DNA helicase subunit RuvA [Geothermobacter ehrlichii]